MSQKGSYIPGRVVDRRFLNSLLAFPNGFKRKDFVHLRTSETKVILDAIGYHMHRKTFNLTALSLLQINCSISLQQRFLRSAMFGFEMLVNLEVDLYYMTNSSIWRLYKAIYLVLDRMIELNLIGTSSLFTVWGIGRILFCETSASIMRNFSAEACSDQRTSFKYLLSCLEKACQNDLISLRYVPQ